jgi:hypothetical protein
MLMRLSSILSLFTLFVTAACAGDSTGPQYNDISGTYAGLMSGVSQGVALQGTFSLTITQDRGALGGSYAMQATLNNGSVIVPVQGTGALSGTVAAGSNPSVNLTVTPGLCPSRGGQFSGTYDTANRRLNLLGPVHIYDTSCTPVLTYQMNFVLNR